MIVYNDDMKKTSIKDLPPYSAEGYNRHPLKLFYLTYYWDDEYKHEWTHTFPSFQYMQEWIKPFIKLGVCIKEYGKIIHDN